MKSRDRYNLALVSRYVQAILIATSGALLIASVTATAAAHEKGTEVIRWTAGQARCTFSSSEDGKYHYALSGGNVDIAMAVDAQELEKIRHRSVPMFGVLLTIRYHGGDSIDFKTDPIALEFPKHFQVLSKALDPDELIERIEEDSENLSHEIEREVRRHPGQKVEKETLLQTHLKDMTDLMGFVSLHCLRPTKLSSENPEITGWVFFSTANKWLGRWKKQESFVLRIPFPDQIYEFPFSLPPNKGEVQLRRRDQ